MKKILVIISISLSALASMAQDGPFIFDGKTLVLEGNATYWQASQDASTNLILSSFSDRYFKINGTTFRQNGRVGVGLPSPTAAMVVNGTIVPSGVPALAVNGTFTTYSDYPDQNRPFVIRRHATDAESLSTFMQDSKVHFVYRNDEKVGSMEFRVINADSESGGGVQANDRVVMNMSSNQSGVFVGIGTDIPDATLTVKGGIHAEEVKVDLTVPGPDYVFEKDYPLPSLEEVKAYIDEHKHLPEVPSAKEMEEEGVNVGEMEMILLKKIEELTLYVIEQDKVIAKLQERCGTDDRMSTNVQRFTPLPTEREVKVEDLVAERKVRPVSMKEKIEALVDTLQQMRKENKILSRKVEHLMKA